MNKYDKFLFDTHRGCFQEKVHEDKLIRTFPDQVDQRLVIGKARKHGVKIIRKRRDHQQEARDWRRMREIEREMRRF